MAFDIRQQTQKHFNFDGIISDLNLDEGMVVADLGSGSGFTTIEAARAVGKRGKVYAVDIQEAPLAALKGKADIFGLRNIETLMANLEIPGDTKIDDGSVDLVVIANLLYQTKKHDVVLAEAGRVCRAGGKLLIVEWKKQKLLFGPDVEIRISRDESRRVAEAAGFKYIKSIDAGDFFYGLLFSK